MEDHCKIDLITLIDIQVCWSSFFVSLFQKWKYYHINYVLLLYRRKEDKNQRLELSIPKVLSGVVCVGTSSIQLNSNVYSKWIFLD